MSLRQCGRVSLLKIIPLRLTYETTGAYTLKVWVGKSSICPISNRPNPLVLYPREIIHDRLTILINRESSVEICEVIMNGRITAIAVLSLATLCAAAANRLVARAPENAVSVWAVSDGDKI